MIDHLSRDEQLWLIEQLVHRLREDSMESDAHKQVTFESQLASMARDPEVRAELQQIDREFAVTERDDWSTSSSCTLMSNLFK